jgi:peroxiredoxin Q/BCP
MVLETGTAVPQVTATNQDGDRVTVDFAAPTVLYFYPRDDTPGCTTEATQFDEYLDRYHEAGVAVYGVSTDDADSHESFAADQGLGFDLLADPEARIAEAFDVDTGGGAADRTTFVCAGQQVCGVYEGVDPDGHARAVLEDMVEIGLVSLDG